ncbi:MAG: Mur ligase family protein [Thermoanaerobaculia bacterium]
MKPAPKEAAPVLAGHAWLDALGPQKIRPGLTRTRALLASLGNPERAFRTVLIGGTNGKGSTAAALASILKAAGIRAGLYTSPHLVRVTERIRIDEEDVAEGTLDRMLALLGAIAPAGARAPTYFEALTVAAIELFRRARVTVAVVEVGIGGSWDATNVLTPELSIVTNVGEDHLDVLGPTLADVARQKAGIFRRGIPALTAAAGDARAILHQEAERLGARLIDVSATDRFDRISPLLGSHQRRNLALAAAAAASLAPLTQDVLVKGIAALRWPGRLQRIVRPGRRELILDGAHNTDGARALAAYLVEAGLSGRVDLLFGGLKDKDLPGMFALLAPHVRRIVLVTPRSPRAETAAGLAKRLGRAALEMASDPAAGLRLLDADSGPDAGGRLGVDAIPIIATGSLILVGDILSGIEDDARAPWPGRAPA